MTTFNAAEIEAWASEYSDAPDVQVLVTDIEFDRRLPQPNAMPAGSPARLIAQNRQTALLVRAEQLGYKPPIKEFVSEIAVETAKSTLLCGMSIGETVMDKLPAPDAPSIAEAEENKAEKKKKRQEKESSGLGFGFDY